MKRSVLLILLLASLIFNAGFLVQSWRSNIVVSVPDGDSLQLADGRRVRLLGIDAPEKGRCMSNEAREQLSYLAKNKHVRLKDIVTDDYGRVLAIVIIEDFPTWISYLRYRFFSVIPGSTRNPSASNTRSQLDGWDDKTIDPLINRAMLSLGLARSTGSVTGEYTETLKAAQAQAKERKLGIYSSECRSNTPTGNCSIKGNVREGKPVYYLPTCKYYDQVIVDEAYGDQWFCTENAAQAAGFVPAPSCNTQRL